MSGLTRGGSFLRLSLNPSRKVQDGKPDDNHQRGAYGYPSEERGDYHRTSSNVHATPLELVIATTPPPPVSSVPS